eukprot:415630_1
MSNKRLLGDSLSELTRITEPPIKKQKLNNNSFQIKSIWFLNDSDQYQFKQLYSIIDNSQLSKQLKITHPINKEIAEYATGNFKPCNGTINCTNKIPILCQDKEIYNNNHNNYNKLGYKYCIESDKYFCFKCMEYATENDCECCSTLHFTPNCNKCHLCESELYICDCGCEFECSYIWECTNNNCNFKGCYECGGTIACIACNNEFCTKCNVIPDVWE